MGLHLSLGPSFAPQMCYDWSASIAIKLRGHFHWQQFQPLLSQKTKTQTRGYLHHMGQFSLDYSDASTMNNGFKR